MSDDVGSTSRFGWQDAATTTSEVNTTEYLVDLIVGRRVHATLVRVTAVTNKPGELKKPGRVDVLPLLNQVDGRGQPTEHETAYGLCYFRYQGGKNAVLLDPEVGDIGLAVICDKDVSAVKAKEDRANPGSDRRGNIADGIYFGVNLGPIPEQYVRFFEEGGDRGIQVHDKNGNDVLLDKVGVRVTDRSKNTIVMDSSGINLN